MQTDKLDNQTSAANDGHASAQSGAKQDSNPMRKIIMIVGIAILVFLGVTTLSVQKSFRSSDQLTSIKDLYFPVLQKIEANIVRLDKMEELFMRAVMIGETDPLDEAEVFYQQADKALVEVAELYPERKDDV